MRRLFVAAVVCAAVLLVTAPAALAWTAPLHPVGHNRTAAHVPYVKRSADRAPLRYEPLARRILSGTGTISLNVYTYDGQPEVNAEADWWVSTDADYGTGHAFTDASGHVDLTGVYEATSNNGEVAVYLDNTTDYGMYDLYNMSWGPTGFSGGLQPGRLPFTLVHDASFGWQYWSAARVRLWAQNAGGEIHMARTDIPKTSATTTGYANTISTGPESLVGGSIYFWDDEGMELSVEGIQVSSGSEATPRQTVSQADAQRVWMDRWGSGKPGTSTWLVMNNYPDNWVNGIYGVADYPSSARVKSFGSFTSTGAEYDGKKMTIPSTAAPGYSYWVWASHDSGPLSLTTRFQTCTLKPSRATVSKGTAIAMSGIVPIKGHYGSKKGTPKYVTIYKTTSARLAAKGQPPVSGGKTLAAKWTKVGKVRTDGLGKYRKGSIRPSRTTWYCAWYPGDSWYWGAWTSVAKVTAR
jgi:hypothetical protein